MSRPDPSGFSTRLIAVVAVAWGLLVWLNWVVFNPVSFRHVWAGILDYGVIRFGPAAAAWGGHALQMGAVALLAAAAAGAGRAAFAWIGAARDRRTPLVSVALGSGVLSLIVLALGFSGLLFRSVAWPLVLAGTCVFLARVRVPSFRFQVSRVFNFVPVLLGLAIAVGLWLALLGSLAPPIAFDSLVHHLAHPQIYIARHKVVALPYHFLSHYPAILEMQYLLAWLVSGGPAAAKLVHCAWGVFVLAVLGTWARERLEPVWALAALAGLAAIPYYQLVMMWGYVDLGAAGYLTAALWAVLSRPRSVAVVAVLCGLCAGTKASGVFAPVLAGAVLLAGRVRLRAWATFLAVFAVVAGPWGAKNLASTGNPFAPFLANLVPTLWWDAANIARYQNELRSYELGHHFFGDWSDLAAYPWRASVRNLGVLDQQAGMSGWFLWLLPLTLFFRGGGRIFGLLALGYFCLWMAIPRQVRYLLPAWPVAALGCVVVLRELARRGGLALVPVGAAGLVLAVHLLGSVQRQHRVINSLGYVFGMEKRDDYLSRGLPGRPESVAVSRWLEGEMAGRRVLVLGEYGLGLYAGPDGICQSVFDTSLIERFAREARSPGEIGKRFRQAGISHVLYGRSGGFVMQAVYRTFNFDEPSAARWRGFWRGSTAIVRNFNDRYLCYRLGRKGEGSESSLPGLNEQLLGEIDFDARRAEQEETMGEEWKGIAERYREAALRTGSSCAWERLGIVLAQAGKWVGAAEALHRAERAGRRTSLLSLFLGVLDAREGRLAAAMGRFRHALELNPTLVPARVNLVNVLWQVGDRRTAAEVIRAGLELDPKSAELGRLWMQVAEQSAVPAPL